MRLLSCSAEMRPVADNIPADNILSIQASERAEVGKALGVHITLTNNLTVALSNCVMVLEGSGLIDGQISNE